LGALAAFSAVALFAVVDLATDVGAGTSVGHVVAEGSIVAIGLAGAAWMARRLVRAQQEARSARARLAATEREAARWREEARQLLEGLGVAVDRQFDAWGLSPAEKEVALLLLKGLSHKEIAGVRSVGEATARQQARAVYQKAGLAGRSDLAAFFLEDLLLPRPTGHAG
jgi:DNA-binding CsgD family transcriptional regulator